MTNETQWIYALSAIQIVSDCPIERYKPFQVSALRDKCPVVRLCRTQTPFSSEGFRTIATHETLTVKRSDAFWEFTSPGDEKSCAMYIAHDYSRIFYMRDDACIDYFFLRLLQAALECASIAHGVLSMHCACVALDGQAVAFTAPSGTGKSTRADAWTKACGAEMISGDRPQILQNDDGLLVCGVPWDGKEQIFRNVQSPIRAILDVRRSEFVRVRKLSEKQKLKVLSNQCFIPMWDPLLAARAFAILRRIARTAPMYRLFCGPDEASAKAVHEILYNDVEQIKEEAFDMQVKKDFVLYEVVGEYMVMPAGDNIGKYNGTVVLNEVSAFIWNKLLQPISYDDLLDSVLAEYEIDRETAKADLDALLDKLREYELLEA